MRKEIEKHGHTSSTHASSPTYNSWRAMHRRCEESTNGRFSHYGGAGVRVCKRWSSFLNFLKDMGTRPKGKTLGRFGDTGNYTLKNCTWMTRGEQEREKQLNRALVCKRGHLRTPENTRPVYGKALNGTCRVCHNEECRRRKRRLACLKV